MKKYFSFPERSVERSKIVQTVSKILNNSHWDHTFIRKWFNNNKYEYISNDENIFSNQNKDDDETIVILQKKKHLFCQNIFILSKMLPRWQKMYRLQNF